MAVAVVNTSGANFGGGTPGTVAYTTVGVDNIIVLHISSEPHNVTPVAVSTVTDTNSLAWTKKASLDTLATLTANTQEVWWAHAPTAISGTITVTMAAAIDDGSLSTLSVSGVYDVANPWDPNSSLPATSSDTGASAAPSVTISTTAAETMVLGFWVTYNSSDESNGSLTVLL